ncbi:helix-turn-helix transcriptional regulator [Niallia taxi]|uniref:helix-turn-helix domain-containing protein n=1 Tax=Niallia taxi TaxID=2499688 RepID=UPI00317CCC4B
MENNNILGEFIRTNRVNKDISLRGLSDITGISFSHLSKIERGEHAPSKDIIADLAKALELSEYDLLIMAGYQTDAETYFWTQVYENVINDERYKKLVIPGEADNFKDKTLEAIKMRNAYLHLGIEISGIRDIISDHFFAVASSNPRKPLKKFKKVVSEVEEELGKEYIEWIELADQLASKGYTPSMVVDKLNAYDDILSDLLDFTANLESFPTQRIKPLKYKRR